MAKGIIVMDMPEKCENCPLVKYITINDRLCCITGKFVYAEQMIKRPDWCPIRKMPEKPDYPPLSKGSYVAGWNDCVDYLEGRNGE